MNLTILIDGREHFNGDVDRVDGREDASGFSLHATVPLCEKGRYHLLLPFPGATGTVLPVDN